ncbi:fatty-acyl-CoA synthase [Saccharopolyspora erythraea NRRL 2338]|uniref:Acyl-CoA synthase n=2 Tax=Saccharopolyspora erythraea TaxID=1836 RepID=A4FC92_SACEN|nr:AMP-binding protein [Saccharopolyspora erythraea]EQD82413.1 acyl-CoA synthetase [Saccharopolyspora erythraea D]PFG95429.1 fatty-acyl-CoA synthase [Saccharopolyspora erythraea NRRL 2338]QRK92067.1 AMP-binding protein [Saccharopolyspora erythraea]CAM01667.1 acyl-CoA synthase [Saccharopolyspora erythraea NRRL 2338]
MNGISDVVRKSAHTAHGLRVMARAGMISGLAVGRALAALKEVRRWGPLVSALRYSARNRPDVPGVVDEAGPVTYRELDLRSTALAAALHARGLKAGDTAAVLCRDHRWLIESLLACGKLGADVLLLNTGFAGPQLADVLTREGAEILVHDEEFTPVVADAHVSLPRYLAWNDAGPSRARPETLEELVCERSEPKLPVPPRPANVVLLTSGTTGLPKGAKREIRSGLTAADFLDRIPLRARESTFISAPLFHAVGFSQLTLGFALGSTLVFHRRFSVEGVVRAVEEQQCTALVLVPTMLNRILDHYGERLSGPLASVRVVLASGSALPPTLCEQTRRVLGEVLYNLYGSTEAAVVSVATPDELRTAPGTVGRPPHTCALRLEDENGARITRPGVSGRIFAGGALAFSGYTDGAGGDVRGGLIGTGDLGHFDGNGLLFVDGRADDMIVSGGENVFPSEVEHLIARHYQVKDVAVVGVDDPDFGQRLRAFVVPIPGSDLEPDEVRDYVRASLARHKVPREVVMVDQVPRNATGKILRRALTDE